MGNCVDLDWYVTVRSILIVYLWQGHSHFGCRTLCYTHYICFGEHTSLMQYVPADHLENIEQIKYFGKMLKCLHKLDIALRRGKMSFIIFDCLHQLYSNQIYFIFISITIHHLAELLFTGDCITEISVMKETRAPQRANKIICYPSEMLFSL